MDPDEYKDHIRVFGVGYNEGVFLPYENDKIALSAIQDYWPKANGLKYVKGGQLFGTKKVDGVIELDPFTLEYSVVIGATTTGGLQKFLNKQKERKFNAVQNVLDGKEGSSCDDSDNEEKSRKRKRRVSLQDMEEDSATPFKRSARTKVLYFGWKNMKAGKSSFDLMKTPNIINPVKYTLVDMPYTVEQVIELAIELIRNENANQYFLDTTKYQLGNFKGEMLTEADIWDWITKQRTANNRKLKVYLYTTQKKIESTPEADASHRVDPLVPSHKGVPSHIPNSSAATSSHSQKTSESGHKQRNSTTVSGASGNGHPVSRFRTDDSKMKWDSPSSSSISYCKQSKEVPKEVSAVWKKPMTYQQILEEKKKVSTFSNASNVSEPSPPFSLITKENQRVWLSTQESSQEKIAQRKTKTKIKEPGTTARDEIEREKPKTKPKPPDIYMDLTKDCKDKDTSQQANYNIHQKQMSSVLVPSSTIHIYGQEEKEYAVLGVGGFGSVHKGRWNYNVVAIKKVEFFDQKNVWRELLVMDRLRHDNIIQLMAASVEENQALIVMPFVNGMNLTEAVFDKKGKQTFGLDRDVHAKHYIAWQICSGMTYLHNLDPKVVHRDVKPCNVMVGHDMKVKLVDFGMSTIGDEMPKDLRTTYGNERKGTWPYMAPEQLLQKSKATIESDVWSLGCLLKELYQETTMWGGKSYVETMVAMNRMKAEGLKIDLSGVPNICRDEIAGCLSFYPNDRIPVNKLLEAYEKTDCQNYVVKPPPTRFGFY